MHTPKENSPDDGQHANFCCGYQDRLSCGCFDSQLKWAGTIRQALESRGFACQMIVPSDIRYAISDGQLAAYGGCAVAYMSWVELVTASLHVDVVVLAMHGPLVRRFCHDLFDAVELADTVPPVTISGWVGVIIEKIIAGYIDRCATDIVAVNSLSNLATFEAVARSLDLPTDQQADEAQMAEVALDPSERQTSRVG